MTIARAACSGPPRRHTRSLLRLDQTGGVARRALAHEELVEGLGSAIDKIQIFGFDPDHARRDAVRNGVEVAFDRRERHTERGIR